MNIFSFFEEKFKSIVDVMQSAGDLPADLDRSRVVFELPREASHGDLACNGHPWVKTPHLDSELILSKVIKKDRKYILLNFKKILNKNDLRNFKKFITMK